MIKFFCTIWLSLSIQSADNLYGALRSVRQITQWEIVHES